MIFTDSGVARDSGTLAGARQGEVALLLVMHDELLSCDESGGVAASRRQKTLENSWTAEN
jgi:hypothetical protein